jgi:hypothetical protein
MLVGLEFDKKSMGYYFFPYSTHSIKIQSGHQKPRLSVAHGLVYFSTQEHYSIAREFSDV